MRNRRSSIVRRGSCQRVTHHGPRRFVPRVERLAERWMPATLTWVGDVDNAWWTSRSGDTNWSGNALPSPGDTLLFAGAARGTLQNNSPPATPYSLSFTASGYTLAGNAIVLSNPGPDLVDVAGGNTVSLGLTVTSGSSVEAVSGTLVVSGLIVGTGDLAKTGNGTLRLDAPNTFSGGTTLVSGTLDVRHNLALGTGPLAIQGGTLVPGGTARSLANRVEILGDFQLGGSNNLTLNAGGQGGISLTHGTRTVTVANGLRTLFLDGPIANGGLVKAGPGRLALTRANAFADGVELQSGLLSLGDSQALGTGPVRVLNGSLQADGAPRDVANRLSLLGNVSFTGTQSLTFRGPIDLAEGRHTITVTASAPITWSGPTTGDTLLKSGPGSLFLLGSQHDILPLVAEGTLEFLGVPGVDTGPLPLLASAEWLREMNDIQLRLSQDFLRQPTGRSLTVRDDEGLGSYRISGYTTARLLVRDDAARVDLTPTFLELPSTAQILIGRRDVDDTLQGGPLTDLVWGLSGQDVLLGNGGSDFLFGGAGDDTLLGDIGFDQLFGGSGNDLLVGGLHDDYLEGGQGVDQVFGEAGYDVFGVRGNEAEFDVWNGGENTDVVINQGDTAVVLDQFDASRCSVEAWDGRNQPIVGNDGPNRLSFLLTPTSSLTLVHVPFIDGGAGDDTLVGTFGADNLRGGSGHDTLEGWGGVDVLRGGTGDDRLDGGEGADWLDGEAGADTLMTGGGRDRVVVAGDESSVDTLTDFALYSDTLVLTAYRTSYASLVFDRRASPGSLWIILPQGKRLRLVSWTRPVPVSQLSL